MKTSLVEVYRALLRNAEAAALQAETYPTASPRAWIGPDDGVAIPLAAA